MTAKSETPAAATGPAGADRLHVLVIEDVAAQRLLLREIFVSEGFIVSEAADGKEGLARLSEVDPQRIALIVLDLIMPKLGGIAFIRVVHEQHGARCPPILVCTARADRGMVELARDRQVAGYILKPYDTAELMKRARELIRASGRAASCA